MVPPEDMDGLSMVPLVGGVPTADRPSGFAIEYYTDEVFPRIANMGYRALRTDRYKYIRYEDLEGMDELYDLTEDPHELTNILDGADAGLIASLDEQLDRHLGLGPGGSEP